ncbi:shikimate dehydrogenase [soil metagenome]
MRLPAHPSRLIALLGDPVRHSLSPVFQNAAIRAAGLDGIYMALRTDSESLPGLMRGIAMSGGGGNVTVPHKRLAATILDVATGAVEKTGACNTFWCEDGLLFGDNTDVAGFGEAVRALLGEEPRGARVLLIGAGGAARAVLCSLADSGASRVDVINRTPERATALAEQIDTGGMVVAPISRSLPDNETLAYDLVVNATSLGLNEGDADPVAPHRLGSGTAALDLVYRPGCTSWVKSLRARGIRATDGTEMLVQQGAAAFVRWWGIPAPVEEMRVSLTD